MSKKLIIPQSVAFIMDGNGRWARKRGLVRTAGHKAAVATIKNLINNCKSIGIKYITLYAFSTENWNRPKDEVDFIFDLFENALVDYTKDMVDKGIRFNIIGDRSRFSDKLNRLIDDAINRTQDNSDIVVTFAVNYGGRSEIVQAVNKAVEQGESVTEQSFKDLLYTHDIPDPDLVVRTSGEKRISNFLLYQIAYSEFYFPKTYWPAFDRRALMKAIRAYSKRDRRYGGIKNNGEKR